MPASAEQVAAGEATRAALVRAARDLFVTDGYFATGTNAIVEAAQVTRGALYHHFADKLDLFRAVVDQIAGEIVDEQIAIARSTGQDGWDDLRDGLLSFLRAVAASRELQQVLFVDGPAALGWHEWGEVQSKLALGLIAGAVDDAVTDGLIVPLPATTIAAMLLGVLNAAAVLVTTADEPDDVFAEVEESVAALLDGLRVADR